MRVSAWTAYGLLRELERLGLVVRRSAIVRPGLRGRSQVLFAPAATEPDPASSALAALRTAFDRFTGVRDDFAAASAFLADPGDLPYQLGFWLAQLAAAGRQAGEAARSVLEGGAQPVVKVQTVAAMGLGSALTRIRQARLARQVAFAGSRFNLLLEEAGRASDERVAALADAARRIDLGVVERSSGRVTTS
jgi:molybdopterin-guanine dinucleotide biosynthesis protein A